MNAVLSTTAAFVSPNCEVCVVCGVPVSSALQGGKRSQKVVGALPLWCTAFGTQVGTLLLVGALPLVRWLVQSQRVVGTMVRPSELKASGLGNQASAVKAISSAFAQH